ncbi:MAG: sigma-E factor negative regulatory protein, partial [Pseudomonadota bacterium]|nr:sigma-E factor negative regulatory protein [Pseudomonadota bacterium]
MSEQIREQVSAFLDGELPNSETELLLKRLTRDVELRESFGRYALIGESMRGTSHSVLTRGFTARINRTIDVAAPTVADVPASRVPARQWWRPLAGAAVAAGVAAIAVVTLQQRAVAPVQVANDARFASSPVQQERLLHAVSGGAEVSLAMPAARLTNYVFAHSKYSSVLDQSNVLS